MTGLRDDWIAEHSVVAPETLHALGAVTLHWNLCEAALRDLFACYVSVPHKVFVGLTQAANPAGLCEALLDTVRRDETDRAVRAVIERALQAFDICRRNRNDLVHFTVAQEGALRLRKIEGTSSRMTSLADDLNAVRRIATEIAALHAHLRRIVEHLQARQHRKRGAREAHPLPELIPIPEALT